MLFISQTEIQTSKLPWRLNHGCAWIGADGLVTQGYIAVTSLHSLSHHGQAISVETYQILPGIVHSNNHDNKGEMNALFDTNNNKGKMNA